MMSFKLLCHKHNSTWHLFVNRFLCIGKSLHTFVDCYLSICKTPHAFMDFETLPVNVQTNPQISGLHPQFL